MKRILFILSLLTLLSPRLFASTNVGASLSENTQWDQTGSPYIVQGRVLVPPGVTLNIGPGVQVVFQGPATLQISGELKIEGSAATPAVINMMNGGLRNTLLVDGGEAYFSNMKILSGVFLAQDATVRMEGCEVTKGSGLYLKGNTVAHLKNNKFYGNATGVVLDGPVETDMQFNTLVQNTYGLYLKDFSKITFLNNSIHDNDSDVVNNGSKAKLGGNYWGTLNPQTAMNKIKGSISLSPMRDIKDILRAYLRSELPVITKVMSDQAEKEDRQTEKAAKEALKEFRAKQQAAAIPAVPAANNTPTPISTATPVPVEAAVPTATMAPASDLLAPPPSAEALPPAPTAAPAIPITAPASGAPSAPSDLGADIPMPPSSASNAPEPPALGNLAASAEAPPSLPAEQNAVPTNTPTPADTSMELSPAPADLTDSVPPPAAVPSPVSQQPAPGDLTSTGEAAATPTLTATSNDLTSIVATAQAASSTPTILPTIALPDLGSNSDLTNPPDISSPVMNDTATFTSTPVVPIATPTPEVSNASSPASPASGSLMPMAPNDVPPPPDLGSSNAAGTQSPPALPDSNAAPLPPPTTSDQSPKAASSPTDVDGMQPPPMDSGLDFAAPQK
jgi:hypothetical protein